jgi:2-aminoadipate transaminase
MSELHLSAYGALSGTPSPVNAMMAEFARDFRDGIDINLGVGYVNENTIPDRGFLEAAEYVLTHPAKYRCALNYGGPKGSANLIESLRRFHVQNGIGGLTDDVLSRNELIIGANGATSILTAFSDILSPGIVITTDPMYYIYCNTLERKGFEIVTIPEDEEGMSMDALNDTLDAMGGRKSQIAFLYIVTVNNPTCSILPNRRRRQLVERAACLSKEAGHVVPLILDKAYEFLMHDPSLEPPESALTYDESGAVYEVGTLSKILAPALRIGYLMGPPGPMLDALIQWNSDIGFSAPLINQEIASYLLDRHVLEQQERVNQGYREKAQETRALLERHLGGHLAEIRGGRAGFYYYLTFSSIPTVSSGDFFKTLTRPNGDPRVIYIPGEYCVRPGGLMAENGRRQLRLSYGFEEMTQIRRGIELMGAAAESKCHI